MASSSSIPEEDLTCPVCIDIFTDPVLLKCSHSFCKACLRKCWEESKAGECPICRDKTTEDPTCNRGLKNLCEAFLKHKIEKPVSTSESLCSIHGEGLKLYCLADEELICVICQTSKEHENHKLRPVKEAVLKNKEEIDVSLRVLLEKLQAFNEEKQKRDQEADSLKSQTECTTIQIQEEFEKLHQFLRDEEAARIAALREEEEKKSQKMKERVEKMTKEISSLTETIRALEKEMKADDISFLQKYKVTKKRAQCNVSDPEKVSEECINVAKHLGNLKYRVLGKMLEIFQFTPVLLDPNAKGDDLTVSEDLTSLRYSGETELNLADDEDDDDNLFKIYVLGSESFSSGKHCWDVEVGENSTWVLGVAENASDAGEPEWVGMWVIGLEDGKYGAFSAVEDIELNVTREVKKVRVQLDWDRGMLSFSDPTNDTSLHTFKHKFTKRLVPLFSVGSGSDPLIPLFHQRRFRARSEPVPNREPVIRFLTAKEPALSRKTGSRLVPKWHQLLAGI